MNRTEDSPREGGLERGSLSVISPAEDSPREGGPFPLRGSIRRRVTLALVGVSVLTLLAVGSFFYGFLGRYVVGQKQDQMFQHTVEVAHQVSAIWSQVQFRPVGGVAVLRTVLQIDMQVLPRGAGITLFQEGGRVLLGSGPPRTQGEQAARLYPEALELAKNGPAAATFPLQGDTRLIVAASPVDLGVDGEGLVVLTLPTSDAVSDRRGLLRVLLASGALAVGLAVLVGLGLGAWIARPLKRLSASARSMAAGAHEEPVAGGYPGEVYELAASLEHMRREVLRSEASLRGFVAAAAHELRTPLTSIQGFSQALLDGTAATPEQRRRSAATIYRESGRLRRLVDALLTLSRFDSREFMPNRAAVDAAAVVREQVEALAEAGLVDPDRIRVDCRADTTLVTDGDMFRQVVANLLHNAVQYGGDDPVDVVLAGNTAELTLTVANGGPPLATADRSRVFERFFRGPHGQRTEGSGLGLSLVKEICEVLGGRVELLPETPRTVFRVTMPRR